MNSPRRVMIGTPVLTGQVDVRYCYSLVQTVLLGAQKGIQVLPFFIAHDAMLTRARNDIVRNALESKVDDIVFIDCDQEWNPEWVFRLLEHKVDFVGAPVIKKGDEIAFNIKRLSSLEMADGDAYGLIEVEFVGTGMLRVSRQALEAIWDISEKYVEQGRENRMVFENMVIDGELTSEDNVFCHRWRSTGGKVYIDPSMTCNHVGVKVYSGNFLQFLRQLKAQEAAA